MASRSYGQDCAVAAALDLVGERWTLLVIRELLSGPKRYTDLQEGLPGIATDVLAARLRDLETNGLVARTTLPPPAASKVYSLTEDGAGLEPVLLALAAWGTPRLATSERKAFRPHWFGLALRARFRPVQAHEHVTVDFVTGADRVRVRIAGASLVVDDEVDGQAEVIVQGTVASIAALVAEPERRAAELASGRVTVEGDDPSISVLQRAFGTADEHGQPAS